MSLRARLRLAVALLMSATVAVLSGLYIQTYLKTALSHTVDVAQSLGNQVQRSILDELDLRARLRQPPLADNEAAKRFWIETAETDPFIAGALRRALDYWKVVDEVFVTDESGRVLASSTDGRVGQHSPPLSSLVEWRYRPLPTNLKQIYVDRSNSEIRKPIGLVGDSQPILTIHVVVSSIFLRDTLYPGIEGLARIGVVSFGASIILALVLPNFILNPLERLSRRLDLMAKGKFAGPAPPEHHEAKEFAAVYTKLDALGQQFRGAQEDVDLLRGNVEQLLERLEEAVLLFDATGRLTMAGNSVGPLLGIDPNQIMGRTVEEIFPADAELGSVLMPAISGDERVHPRSVNLTVSDHEVSLLVSAEPLRRATDGQRMGTLVKLRDAATRGELAAQLDVAGRLTALSQLTRGVAHEIKNPLNAITVHLEVLRARLEEEAPELGVIRREISRLDRVVKTFLDFNRPVEPRLRPIDLNEMARDIAGLVGPEAASRGINFEVDLAPRPAIINGDVDLLKQAILNVVMNGVEAMKDGGSLRFQTRRGRGTVEVIISDTGPGIPLDIQDKIFNLYFSTKQGGSGIGLAMAFRFVQLHDGKIEFSSQIGSGTTFRFSFPEAASKTTPSDVELWRTHRA